MPCKYSEYPPNWKEIRKRILERAENKCEICGVPNHVFICRPKKNSSDWDLAPEGMSAEAMWVDGMKLTKIVLTIAHMKHDKGDDESTLKALCQRCHLIHDLEHHKANRKYGRNHKKVNYKLDL